MTTSLPSRRTVLVTGAATGVAASLPPLLSVPANAAPAPSSPWRDVTASLGPDVTGIGKPFFLGPHEGWALGAIKGRPNRVLLRFNGRRWIPEVLPEFVQLWTTPEVSSRRHMWALGLGGGYVYDGEEWRRTAFPETPPADARGLANIPVALNPESLSAGRDGTAWVALADTNNDKTLVLHWDGTAWVSTKVPLPNQWSVVTRLAVRSRRDIWVAGRTSSGGSRPFTLHWDGHSWTDVAIPPVEGNSAQVIRSVVSVSKNLAWAFRSNAAVGQHQTLLRWTGGPSWEDFRLPPSDTINIPDPPLADDGRGGAWVGAYGPSASTYLHFLDGTWTLVQGPARVGAEKVSVSGLTRIPGTRTVLAVGSSSYQDASAPSGHSYKSFLERLH
ncbi:hypothetical protein [Actinomadura roseirufa]|uniref:hypothetical protein n=1 Tax=Actinomadura roseirufa TaxID=2094049 RepID=UPI00104106AA|nr:hypothetical protein [Actinomadura roseirufa]